MSLSQAATTSFDYLQQQLALRTSVLARVTDGDCQLLEVRDQQFGLHSGQVIPFEASICGALAEQQGPLYIPDITPEHPLAQHPTIHEMRIRCLINLPIKLPDQRLFGAICAFNPSPIAQLNRDQQTALEQIQTLIGLLAEQELRHAELERRYEQLEIRSEHDPDSGLHNRQGWERLVQAEENRCRRYASPASILLIETRHTPSPEQARDIGERLQHNVRQSDLLARLSLRQFVILLAETDLEPARHVSQRISEQLKQIGIDHHIGSARRDARADLHNAVENADLDVLSQRYQRH